jgi:hypothetical protein
LRRPAKQSCRQRNRQQRGNDPARGLRPPRVKHLAHVDPPFRPDGRLPGPGAQTLLPPRAEFTSTPKRVYDRSAGAVKGTGAGVFPAQADPDPPRRKLFTHYEWQSSERDLESFGLTTGPGAGLGERDAPGSRPESRLAARCRSAPNRAVQKTSPCCAQDRSRGRPAASGWRKEGTGGDDAPSAQLSAQAAA